MWESIGLVAAKGGPVGLIALVVVSLLQGWLIPRRSHLDRVEDLKERIADLKAACAALEATVDERERQIGILLTRAREPVE